MIMDESTTIGELRTVVRDFVDARDWNRFHTPKHLAMSIAIEAAEIMEHFQWRTAADSIEMLKQAEMRDEVADELADVMIYCLSFANSADIDISTAIAAKIARNEVRFPVEQVRGKNEW